MRRTIITILSTALVVGVAATVVNAAGGSDREVAASSAAAQPQKLLKRGPTAQAAVKCRTVKCINKQLTKLNNGVFKCERILAVTQYSDFALAGGGATTGLDLTAPNDQPTANFVVDIC